MKWKMLIVMVLTLALVTTVAHALPVVIEDVEVDGTQVFPDAVNALDIERGQEIDVRVELTALEDIDNVELLVFLSGYEYNDRDGESISRVLGPYNLKADTTYVRTAAITLPYDLEVDEYKLRLVLADRVGDELMERYSLQIDTPKHALQLTDTLFVPGLTVRAGEALISKVRLENKGQRTEEDIRVTVEVPDLGLKAQGFINEIEDGDEQEESEELLLRIPTCTEAGTYPVRVKVDFNRNRDTLQETYDLEVLESDLCKRDDGVPKTTILVGTDFQTIGQGESGIYSLTVQNNDKTSTSYNVVVSAPQGLLYKISPTSAAVLAPSQAQTFYVFVEASQDATAGPNVLTASVNAGAQSLQQISLTANVKETSQSLDLARVLEVGLVVLIVLLVVIGLIVGLSRLRGSDDKDGTQYY
ncbi:hypothetical protein GF342_02910 [Candidatus Woesearchaeota archaeon]|nr:hypothetical protein [Candidatus Woesearchaeota archaeon]